MGVFANSPAAKAGFQTGDVITQWDGKAVETCEMLILLVAETEIGSQVDALIQRDGGDLTLQVNVELRPKQIEPVSNNE